MTTVIIFDTEYTTWAKKNNTFWPEVWMKKEIVQIAAIKLNIDNMQIIEEFECLIKPTINPLLSDEFVNLTGINNEDVAKCGISFSEGFNKFYNFAKGLDCWSFNPREGNPLADGHIIKENLRLNNLAEDNLNYINIHPYFKEEFAKIGIDVLEQKINSGKIAKTLGLDQNIKNLGHDEHNALYDVLSMYQGYKYFEERK